MSDTRKTRVKRGDEERAVDVDSGRIKPKTVHDRLPVSQPMTSKEIDDEMQGTVFDSARLFDSFRGKPLSISMQNGTNVIGTVSQEDWLFLPLEDAQIQMKNGEVPSRKIQCMLAIRLLKQDDKVGVDTQLQHGTSQ